jgi:hypothetical protein
MNDGGKCINIFFISYIPDDCEWLHRITMWYGTLPFGQTSNVIEEVREHGRRNPTRYKAHGHPQDRAPESQAREP